MKYQVRRYKIDNPSCDLFKSKVVECGVRIHKEELLDDHTIFITDKAVDGFSGDIGIIESDSNGEKVEIIREPFIQHPITLKELFDTKPNLIDDYKRFTLLTEVQRTLFENHYAELAQKFEEQQEDLNDFKMKLIASLLPLVSQDSTLIAYLDYRRKLDDQTAENSQAVDKLKRFKEDLEKEYDKALAYMRTDDERKLLTSQYQKSIDYVDERLKDIIGAGEGLFDKAVSDDVVREVRVVAEGCSEAFQLLEALSEARQLLSYARKEPYEVKELTMSEISEILTVVAEKHKQADDEDKYEGKSELDFGSSSDGLEDIEDKSFDDNNLVSDEPEIKNADEDESEEQPEDKSKRVRGSMAIANLMESINADYTPDSELEQETPGEKTNLENNLGDNLENEEEEEEMKKPEETTGEDVLEMESDNTESEKKESPKAKGFSTKTGIILSSLLFTVSLAGAFFLYQHNNKEVVAVKREVVEKAQKLEELNAVKELDQETYEELIGRFLENHEGTKESKRDGLSGMFSHDGTMYFVRRFVRETGTLETYNTVGEKVDFNVDEVETIIENGEW